MAILRPFKAIRPSKGFESKIISKPYDVIDRNEAKAIAEENPYSFLHISRSEVDLPDEVDQYSKVVYEKAKENINKFIDDGILMRESKDMIYIYKQTMGEKSQTGIVGCASIDDYINDVIKKHEYTRVEKENDRINHFDVVNANTEPVFLTYRDNKKIRVLIEGYMRNNLKEYNIVEDDVRHEIWAVKDDNVVNGICGLFKDIKSFYIADGHHRTESAYKVCMKRRAAKPKFNGNEEFNYFLAAVFPDSDVKVFDYNRVIKDLNGNSVEEFLKKIKDAGFIVINLGKKMYKPDGVKTFGMFLEGSWYKLIAEERIIPEEKVGSLDVSILQNNIIGPLLDIKDIRTDKRIDFVGGIRGLDELERRVNKDMAVAFCLHPVSVFDIMEISDKSMIMPPKSTWFAPKLASGLFIHKL